MHFPNFILSFLLLAATLSIFSSNLSLPLFIEYINHTLTYCSANLQYTHAAVSLLLHKSAPPDH